MRFNPRARDGREERRWFDWSTHIGFNPRARDGRELMTTANQLDVIKFQSTRP